MKAFFYYLLLVIKSYIIIFFFFQKSLTSPTYCSNHSLSEHLDIFIRAIHFYCKDFDSIEKKAKDDRLKLIQEFENVCQLITPLIDQFHNDIDESFKPTKYKEFYGFAPVSGSVVSN